MRGITIALALLTFAATNAAAQRCDLVGEGAEVMASNIGQSNQTAIIRHGELLCGGVKYLKADEMGTNEAIGIVTMNRNVVYRDPDKIVTADFATFFKKTSIFQARGNVVVIDRKSGSKITAPALDYYQVTSSNKQARMITSNGRAHATLRQTTTPAPGQPAPAPTANANAATSQKDSTQVDADVIEIIGERVFKGTGTSIISRPDMHGFSHYVEYDQDRGDLLLAKNARIEGDKYRLVSDTIRAIAEQGKEVREIRAARNAVLTSDEVRVESPFLRIYLDSGVVNRLVATRPLSGPDQPVSLPRVLSKAFNVSADSIDALAPKQLLQQVDAVGHAFGEKLDSVPPPAAAKEMPNVLTNDWLRGDTLHATFVENPDARPNSKGQRTDRILQRIVATGSTASSAIRMQQPKDSTWKIYYTLANIITVDFAKGVVSNVDLKGNVHGLFLTPQGSRAPSPITPPGKRGGGQ